MVFGKENEDYVNIPITLIRRRIMYGFFGFNPTAVCFVGFCTGLTVLTGGTWLLGLTIGLGIITVISIVQK